MQYHLNGFRAGDPHVKQEAAGSIDEDIVDVLIVGCGPAGLTLAAQLSVFANINTRIVERKDGPLELGQADGLACRTIEMFEAFGFSHHVIREAYNVVETVFWSPDESNPSNIIRSGRIQDVADDLSEFPHLILNQARVHDMYLKFMLQSPRRLQPDYGYRIKAIDDSSENEFVTVHLNKNDQTSETLKARYVVGCDGARSMVRQCINLELLGDSANQAWGVMDVLLVTDFPDIRFKSVIGSAQHGNLLVIPREGGYLVRLYIELDQLNPGERVSAKNIQADDLAKAAQRIFHPFKLDVKQLVWWSVYEIGQRLSHTFDNSANSGSSNGTTDPRVFIAGDACHTHSPKAGQGMNVAMADAFNLGWKLAAVLRGCAQADLLKSYSVERHAVAHELIEFDRHWAARFSEAASHSDSNSTENKAKDFQTYFTEHGRYTAGVAVAYQQSALVADGEHQSLATGLTIGMRFHSAMVTRISDALPMQLGHTIKADGRWRLFLFASEHDPKDKAAPVWKLCDYLSTDPLSPMCLYQEAEDDPDSVFDLRVIFQQSHSQLNTHEMHPFFKPFKGSLGLQDNDKMLSSVVKDEPDIFGKRGISRDGCMMVVRPDQYIADIMPLDATARLTSFFSRIFIPKT